jgi:hypothetical protein
MAFGSWSSAAAGGLESADFASLWTAIFGSAFVATPAALVSNCRKFNAALVAGPLVPATVVPVAPAGVVVPAGAVVPGVEAAAPRRAAIPLDAPEDEPAGALLAEEGAVETDLRATPMYSVCWRTL